MRHQGTLPAQYTQRLEEMSLDEIAIEAAHLRSDGRLCGTSTALILRWLRRTSPADFEIFMALYREAWLPSESLAERVVVREFDADSTSSLSTRRRRSLRPGKFTIVVPVQRALTVE